MRLLVGGASGKVFGERGQQRGGWWAKDTLSIFTVCICHYYVSCRCIAAWVKWVTL